MNPAETLARLKTLLPDTLLLEVSQSSLNTVSMTVEGGLDEFVNVCRRIGAPVVFVEHVPLNRSHFTDRQDLEEPRSGQPPADLFDFGQMTPFHRYLGDDMLLVYSVPHSGVLVQMEVQPDWWDTFEEALEGAIALHQEREAKAAERRAHEHQAQKAEVEKILRAQLPQDSHRIRNSGIWPAKHVPASRP